MEHMSERLRQARKNAGFPSASAAARAHGWRPSTYIAHENRQNQFDAAQAEMYGKAFKVPAEWLLLGKSPPNVGIDAQLRQLPPEEAQKLVEKFNAMIEGVRVVSKIK